MWPVLEPVLQPLLILFGAIVLAVLVLGVVHGLAQKGRVVWAMVLGGHALLVLLLMVTWVNGRPGFFEENTRLVHVVAGFKELWNGPPDPREQGVDLILVDQVRSKVVIDAFGTVNAGGGVPITDRRQLAQLMEVLAAHRDHIGLVVCDIIFDRATADDSLLAEAMLPLIVDRKLLLAHGESANTPLLHFDEAMGSVTVGTQADRVVRQVLRSEQGRPTLPYLMHARYHGFDARPWRWGFFMEELRTTGTIRTYPYFLPFMDRLSETSYVPQETLVGGGTEEAQPLHPLELRDLVKASAFLLVPRIMESPAAKGPVIFIGEFLSAPELGSTDIHLTFRGEMHGATILLNQFLELERGAHHFKWAPLRWQFLLLVLASWIIFRHFRRNVTPRTTDTSTPTASTTAAPQQPAGLFRAVVRVLWEYAVEAAPAVLIAAAFGLVGWCYHQPANVGALILYLIVLDRLSRFANTTSS